MNETAQFLTDRDLLEVIDLLMPSSRDREKMLRALRDDEDILDGMLSDEKLFTYLTGDPDRLISVSPFLFFTVLLKKVKAELKQRSYTVEQDSRHRMVVFDGGEVVHLLEDRKILNYLARMLVSFVKINTFSVMTQVKKGVWRRYRFSDFDVENLITYSSMIDEEQRFEPYRRIADICLFIMGIFPEFVEALERRTFLNPPAPKPRTAKHGAGSNARLTKEGYVSRGKYFYRAAGLHRAAQLLDMHQTLLTLSEMFPLAVKPLAFMTKNYLSIVKEKLFLQ